MSDHSDNQDYPPKSFEVRILRQDGPGEASYWEVHRVDYEQDMNVISVLQHIAAQARTASGSEVTPVAWDCNCLEEVCGACTMVINGKVRQSCSSLVDNLLKEHPSGIVLKPMSKFPVVRDLVVDRSRLFHSLQRSSAWIPVDSYYDAGAGPPIPRKDQERMYPLSQCMSCGCCLEACPQFTKIELPRKEGETDQEYQQRQEQAFEKSFIGAHAISQIVLFNSNPTGKQNETERLETLTAQGGIQGCGNAQNCAAVCPKEIPLTTSIAQAGRAVTVHSIRNLFQ